MQPEKNVADLSFDNDSSSKNKGRSTPQKVLRMPETGIEL
jgi:hypothetical protein